MASHNEVLLIGNLGRDPESTVLPSGQRAANFSVATTKRFKDKATGERKERTEWHRITAYDALAEIAADYAKSGREVFIRGELRTRKWQGEDGQDRYTTEVVADKILLLGPRPGGQGGDFDDDTPAD